MKKIILTLFIGIFLISFVSPVQQSLGTFKQGEDINLIQICDNCSYNNISSILYPNSSVIISNVAMTKDDTYYNYTFWNTSTLGNYIVNGYGDLDGVKIAWSYDFEITLTGQEFTTGKAISYIGFIIIILFIFLLTLYGAIKVRWKHPRNNNQIIGVNNFRYIKVFLFSMTYVLAMFLFGLSYKFFNEADFQGFTDFFYYGWVIFQSLLIPVIITMIVIFFIIFITNLKIKTKLKLGL